MICYTYPQKMKMIINQFEISRIGGADSEEQATNHASL